MSTDSERTTRRNLAFTMIEVLVVLATLAVLVLLLMPALTKARTKANRIHCVSHLKNIGLSFRIFTTDHTNRFPFQLSTNFGGSQEYANDASQLWRQFAVLTNELVSAVILYCPMDRERHEVRSFSDFTSNQQLSYFLGLGASEEDPQSILSGDRNLLLDGKSLEGQVVTLSGNANVAFDQRIHREAGNILLGDGSVQQVTSARLREQFREAARPDTNTLVIP